MQISKLSLLVGTKSVGDSVRRIMIKMFNDEILTSYSLQGFKKKKCFQKLSVYHLLIGKLILNIEKLYIVFNNSNAYFK